MINTSEANYGLFPRMNLENFKAIFYYFCNPKEALLATFEIMQSDLSKCKDSSILQEYESKEIFHHKLYLDRNKGK